MADSAAQFIPGLEAEEAQAGGFTTGVLPSQQIRDLMGRDILVEGPLDDDQIQPSSIDLRLGDVAWRVRSSFLPGPKSTVEGKLRDLGMHRIDLTDGAVLSVLHGRNFHVRTAR